MEQLLAEWHGLPGGCTDSDVLPGLKVGKIMNSLKLCPFCNGSAKVEKKNSGYQVRCQVCGARGKYVVANSYSAPFEVYLPKDVAIEAWNRRSGI